MKREERRKGRLLDKVGSYIVEAAMSLPLLILCVVALALIIRIIAICEGIGFASAAEMKDAMLAVYATEQSSISIKSAIEDRVREENATLTEFDVSGIRYRYSDKGIDELIGIHTAAEFRVAAPVGINGKISFSQSLLVRGFTGKTQLAEPLSAEEFMRAEKSCEVIVFPKYGLRYHSSSCRYVKNGKDKEYQIEMEKEDAKARGYTACLVCKGGEI